MKTKHEYWLVPNSMFAIQHVIRATPMKRLARKLGLGYQRINDTVFAASERQAANAFKEKGHQLGYYSRHRSLPIEDDQASKPQAEKLRLVSSSD